MTRPTADAVREVTITRVFHAPRELVWEAWTDPKHAVHWYGPAGYTTPVCGMDVRTGGRFRICMRSSSGSECWEQGVFHEVAAPDRIAMAYTATVDDFPGVELTTIVTFEARGCTTLVTVRQSFLDDHFTEGAESGTNQSLDRLAAYLGQITTVIPGDNS